MTNGLELTPKHQLEIAILAKTKAQALLQTLCDEPWPELTPAEFEAMKPLLRIKIRATVGNYGSGLPLTGPGGPTPD